MIPDSVSTFVEHHWTPISALLASQAALLGGFWLYIFKAGGRPSLERWNTEIERGSRDQATDTLFRGIRNLPGRGSISKDHQGCVISGLDQLHKSQVRYDARHKKIQSAHRHSIAAVVFSATAYSTHQFDIGNHRFCAGCAMLSLFGFAAIWYLWSPLIIHAHNRGIFPREEGATQLNRTKRKTHAA